LVEAKEDMRLPIEKMVKDPLDDNTRKYLAIAYVGEFWAMATRAILDSPLKEEAMKSLFHRLQLLGSSIGLQIKRGTSDGSSIKTINRTVQLISDLHRRTSQMNINGNLIECTISDCPFAGTGVMDICLQYQAFFNGICEAIDPCYEFAYDRMMTKGDKTCHWTIRKKGDAANEKAKEVPLDDPIKMLTTMYIKGEITEEELEKKVAHLRKLGLVK
jgi:hypothetical protein